MHHIALEAVDSTNSEAERRIADGSIDGWTLITATEQLAGRGRLARGWVSPPGNFYGSFVIPRDHRSEWRRPWLAGFAAALALAGVIEQVTGKAEEVRIKWPNDVLVNGAKVSGILAEAGTAAPFIIIGIGVNLVSHPCNSLYPTTHLSAHGAPDVTPPDFANLLAPALMAMIERWLEHGFGAIRPAYVARSHHPGEWMRIRANSDHPVSGTFIAIDEDGCLSLSVDGQTRRLAAGDVFPGLNPAS